MSFFGGIVSNVEQDVENLVGGAVNQATQGIERGAAAAMNGAVHDVLGLPQANINTLYNIGGFAVGALLLVLGTGMVIAYLFGDVVRDAIGGIENVLGGGAPSSSATAAKGATIGDTVAETAALL